MDPQPELAGMEHPERPIRHGPPRRVQVALAAAFPRGHPAVGARRDPVHLGPPLGPLLHRPRRPRRAPGRATRPVLKVNCWGRTWGPLKATLGRQGIILEPGMVVTLRGRVEFYAPRGPGQLHRRRARRARAARSPGASAGPRLLAHARDARACCDRNRALAVPDVPLRVGLVASPGTEGYHDFVGQLRRLGARPSAWSCSRPRSRGPAAPASVVAGLAALAGAGLRPRRRGPRRWVARRPGRLRRRARGPRHRHLPGAGVDRDRPHRRPVGGRHRRQPRLRHADGVWPGDRPSGRASGGSRWPSAPARVGRRRGRRARRPPRGATPRPARRLGTGVRRQLARHSERLERPGRRGSRPRARAPARAARRCRWTAGRRASGPRALGAPRPPAGPGRRRGGGCSPPTTSSASSSGATPSPSATTAAWCARSSELGAGSALVITRFADGTGPLHRRRTRASRVDDRGARR